jgi:beta-1,4-mannosyl-glycoprotein beta-1,4-N-acetylglucosaminyltransferase
MWIDCFLFNGDWIAKPRMAFLDQYVDQFYVVEGRYTHSGVKKEQLFIDLYADWFKPYAHKIKFIINEKPPQESWIDENYHRDFVISHLPKDEDYILAVTDCDEIYDPRSLPLREELRPLLKTTIVYPYMASHCYRFSLVHEGEGWMNPFLIGSSMVRTMQPSFSEIRVYKKIRGSPFSLKSYPSGWHLSYFLSAKEIQRKLQSFAHTELNQPHLTDLETIGRRLQAGEDVLGRNKKLTAIELYNPVANFPFIFNFYARELQGIQSA